MTSGIYKLYWNNCQYFYYGQARNLNARWRGHKSDLKRNIHQNGMLQNVFNKYGLPEMSIVLLCDIANLDNKEQYYLDTNINNPYCCNVSPSVQNRTMSEETKNKIRISRTGLKLSDGHKSNIGAGLKLAYSEGRKSISVGKSGSDNSFYNKKHSEQTKIVMRQKSKLNKLGANNGRAKLVVNLETGIFYDCIGYAANSTQIHPQYLRRMLSGDRRNSTSFIYA